MAIHRFTYSGPDNTYLQRECNSVLITVNSPVIKQTMDVDCPDELLTTLQGVMKYPNHFDYVGVVTTPNLRFCTGRFFRESPLVINSSLTHLAFDSISPLTTPIGFTLSGGYIVPSISGVLRFNVCTGTDGVLATTVGLRLKITRDPDGTPSVLHDLTYYSPEGESPVAACETTCSVTANIPIKVELEIIGAASDDLIVGDASSYCSALLIAI